MEEIAGRTPLHFAAVVGDVELIALLIEAGADVNARAQGKYFNGITPLHFAVERGVKDAVSLLIEKGADISAKTESANNDLRKTPLDIAIEREREELIGLLKKNSKNGVMKFGDLVSLIKKILNYTNLSRLIVTKVQGKCQNPECNSYPHFGLAPHIPTPSNGLILTKMINPEKFPKNFVPELEEGEKIEEVRGLCGVYYCPDCLNGKPKNN